jgi:alpha-glucosidase
MPADRIVNSDSWWRGAAIYQVYPRSFADSTGDGLGDLPGLSARLDYIASLGVDGLWICPFFPSPMRDFGYDVSDYTDVDPRFGTLADFDALLARAHALGLKVIIDQVWSHTAIEHPWFEESRQSRDNAKADWYVWADAKDDGSPPTNWQSWMGCATWTWEPRRTQYYLHNFLPQMPDLNFHNREVQDAILDVGRFWLERGVDGFRLDTANYYCHDLQLRDNPPKPAEKRGDLPAAMQKHIYNICQPQTLDFLARIRALTDSYEARFTVAEIGSANNLPRMIEYTQGTQRLHTAYSFLLLGDALSADALDQVMAPWQHGDGATAWPSWAMSNHDSPRIASRWAHGDATRIRQLLALLLTLRGTVFLYQGEELGLTESDIRFEQLQDPYGKAHWPRNKGRDGCRTPMPWLRDAPFAGFSTVEPWLPVNPAHQLHAVDVQETDLDSCLNLTRRLLAMRRVNSALRLGSYQTLHADDHVLLVLRRNHDNAVLIAFNLSDQTRSLTVLESFTANHDLAVTVGDVTLHGQALELAPWSALIMPVSSWPC